MSTLYDSQCLSSTRNTNYKRENILSNSFVMLINRVDEYTSDQAPTPEVDTHKIARTRVNTLRTGMRPTHSTHPRMEPPIPK